VINYLRIRSKLSPIKKMNNKITGRGSGYAEQVVTIKI
jgi:hypothetical protein